LFDLLKALTEDGEARLRANESKLIDLIFEDIDELTELGVCFGMYWVESKEQPSPPEEEEPRPPRVDPNTPAGRHIRKSVKDDVWRRDGARCVLCGSQHRLEFDHIIPHSKGGASTRSVRAASQKLCPGSEAVGAVLVMSTMVVLGLFFVYGSTLHAM